MDMMTRRRAMMGIGGAGPSPYWDYEWDYSMGKLEEQTGWHTDTSGTGSSSIVEDGEKITTNSSAYFQILPDADNPLRFMPDGYGAIEVVCYGKWNNASSGTNNNLRIQAAKNTSNRVVVYPFNGKWRLFNSSKTAIADAANGTEYTIKIVMKYTTADIYIDGAKVASDVSTTQFTAGTTNSIMHQNGGGSSYYGVIKSLKIHLGPEPT